MSPAKKGGKFKSSAVWLIILVVLAFIIIVRFQTSQTIKKLSEEPMPSSALVTVKNIDGIYKGDLPCADCSGITETLILAKDGSYIMEDLYQGKSAKPFQVDGKWEKSDSGILKLTPSDKSEINYFQLTSNGDLQMLDSNMQKIDSPFNNTLTRQ